MKKKSIIFNAILFGSLLLNLVNLKLYEQTIIRVEYLGLFYTLGILIYFPIRRKLKKISCWNDFNNVIFCTIVIGANFTVLFLGLNQYFADKKTSVETYSIIRKTEILGSKYNRRKKSPAINFKTDSNGTKRIQFSIDDRLKIVKANKVELELSDGLFGFKIIRSSKLK